MNIVSTVQGNTIRLGINATKLYVEDKSARGDAFRARIQDEAFAVIRRTRKPVEIIACEPNFEYLFNVLTVNDLHERTGPAT